MVDAGGKFPVRLYPFASSMAVGSSDKLVAIDAKLSFGRPIIVSRGVSTGVMAEPRSAVGMISALWIRSLPHR